jgi:hypothetical protein
MVVSLLRMLLSHCNQSGARAARRQRGAIEPMTLGNMCANGVRSLDVCCWVPPGDPKRGAVVRRRASADVRTAHGAHALRDHRRGRAAPMAGAVGARDPDRCATAVNPGDLDPDQLGALRMLGGSTTGYTVTVMMEPGFKLEMLTEVVSNGLARATRGTLPGGRRPGDVADDHRRGTQGARRHVARGQCFLGRLAYRVSRAIKTHSIPSRRPSPRPCRGSGRRRAG